MTFLHLGHLTIPSTAFEIPKHRYRWDKSANYYPRFALFQILVGQEIPSP